MLCTERTPLPPLLCLHTAEAKLQVLFLFCLSFLLFFFLQSSCFWNVRRLPVLSIFLLEGDSGWICFLLQPGSVLAFDQSLGPTEAAGETLS